MAGTLKGGRAAAKTNKARYGEDYYRKIGIKSSVSYMSKPQHLRKPRGFAAHPELASKVGRRGGLKSRRGK